MIVALPTPQKIAKEVIERGKEEEELAGGFPGLELSKWAEPKIVGKIN